MTDPHVEKPWWKSRAVWGGIVAAVAPLLAMLGVNIDEPQLLNIIMSLVAVAGGIAAVYGRVVAVERIRHTLK